MRPPKRILLLARNEQMASQLRFVLNTGPYVVLASTSYREVLRQLAGPEGWDALLVEYPRNVGMVRPREMPIPLVVFGDDIPLGTTIQNGSSVTMGQKGSMASLLTAVKRATTGKRGPKTMACTPANPVQHSATWQGHTSKAGPKRGRGVSS